MGEVLNIDGNERRWDTFPYAAEAHEYFEFVAMFHSQEEQNLVVGL